MDRVARWRHQVTLFGGLVLQIFALLMLALLNRALDELWFP